MIKKLKTILSIFATYENPFNICYNLFYKKRFPIKLQLKNKQIILTNNKSDIFFLTKNHVWKHCMINGEEITISHNGTSSKFKNWRDSEINAIFFEDEYGYFDLKDKIVVDVGANIADSTVYFAKNGAKKVIALEPIKKNYDMAMENLKLNDLQNQVTLLMVGMGNESMAKKIDQDIIGHSGRPIERERNRSSIYYIKTISRSI